MRARPTARLAAVPLLAATAATLAATLTVLTPGPAAHAVGTPVAGDPLTGTGQVSRTVLTASQLASGAPTGTVADSAFALPANAAPPAHEFTGTLTLQNVATSGGYSPIRDPYGYGTVETVKHLPAMSLRFVQNGSHLVPADRGLRITGNASWNYVVSPGRVWKESGDGGKSRAAFPFALVERNANCVHNGVMTFLFDASTTSQVRYQVTQETCEYHKFDMWGQVSATWNKTAMPGAAAIGDAYAAEVADRLPTKPISSLATDYPSAGLDMSRFGSGVTPAHMTAYGFYYKGVNYVSTCGTRQGSYAFCDQMLLPSYSTAKSMFGTVAMARLAHLYGDAVPQQAVNAHVAEASGPQWNGVTLDHAADMATGSYTSPGYEVDEAGQTMTDFFVAEPYATKMDVAANGFPRKVAPGTQWVYHTSDTFMLGRAQHQYLRSKQGTSADIFAMLRDDVLKPIKTSAESWSSLRTDNSATGQAFAGYGMFWTQDNIAKVARLLNNDDGKSPAGTRLLSEAVVDAGMQRTPTDRGLPTGNGFTYNNSVWAKQYTSADDPSYTSPFHVPFMSGFGGITVAMMPNGATYYYFSDNNEFAYSAVVKEASKLAPMTGGGGGGCTAAQLIGNGGFETGTAAPWSASPGVIDNRQALQPARTGTWKAWLNGFGYTNTETLSQTVTIPVGCASAELDLYLRIDSAETEPVAYDTLRLEVVTSSGTLTLATWSNLDESGYRLRTFDLKAYSGSEITLRLTGSEDYSLQTSFVVDDVTLDVS
ncbi:hypothetical protein ACFP3Q_06830 [Nocardioides sp. GCM10027113]|uniref:hypothetical protein n=1 Tax=unclassified Nocardioides TaxID=2615069 RepID=UPI003617DC59